MPTLYQNRNRTCFRFQAASVGAIAKLRNMTKGSVASVRPSVSFCPHGINRFPLDEFSLNFVLEDFPKSVDKIQVSLKSDKNNWLFIWVPVHIYNHISLNSSQNVKCFGKICRENQKTHFMFNNFSPGKSYRLLDNVHKYGAAKHTTQDSTMQLRYDVTCMPGQLWQQYKHTLIYYLDCFLID
jgi:hypothetical protein